MSRPRRGRAAIAVILLSLLTGILLATAPRISMAAVEARGTRSIRLDDIARFRELQGIEPSPDGSRAVVSICSVDTKKDAYVTNLWLLNLKSGEMTPLTHHPGGGSSPRYSPDGRRLAFLSMRDERAQIRAMSLLGGESTLLFPFEEDILEFDWFPDGRRIVFAAREPKPEPKDADARKDDLLVFTRATFKTNDDGYLDGRRTHLWVADLDSGTARRITEGEFDHSSPAVSPDGRFIAFVSNRTADPDTNYNTDIFVVPAGGGGPVIRVSREAGAAGRPRWSPDGRSLAYHEQIPPEDYGANSHLWVADLTVESPRSEATASGSHQAGSSGEGMPTFGKPRDLTGDLDLGIAEGSYSAEGDPYPIWSPNGRRLYVALADRARLHAYAVDPGTGRHTLLIDGDRMVEYLTPSGDGRQLIFGLSDGTSLSDVHVADSDGSAIRRLTRLNDDWLREVRVSPPERFTYESFDGLEIEGWIVKPLDFEPGKRYPTVLSIHGGPQWYYGVHFSFYFQLLAAKGYLVIYTNPRGSTGYGEAFARLIAGRYNQDDYRDQMIAVDTIEARGLVDPNNLFVGGYSYGGMMTNWIITQTDRFKAAASGASLADYGAAVGPDDEYITWIAEMGGPPWKIPEKYRALSPMTYVSNARTPTLFYHGLEDYRCPVPESERMYLALKLMGVDTKLVLFPGENHNFTGKASHYPERLRLVIDWFEKHGD